MALLAVFALVCVVAAARELAVWQSDLLSRDRSLQGLKEAIALAPGDASKWRRLGVALLPSDARQASEAFRRAVELNPFDADALVGLALEAEMAGRLGEAESDYRKAMQVSRRFRPAYAAAAFFARQNRMDEFWKTASAAASIEKADLSRIVRLARDAGADPDRLHHLLNLRTEGSLHSFLQMAIAENRPAPVFEVAQRLPVRPAYASTLEAACDRLIEAGAVEQGVELWNRLGHFDRLDPRTGRSLTNPAFLDAAVRGFNWRRSAVPGVEFGRGVSGLQVEFSGSQSEGAVLLEQPVPVLAGRRYRFSSRHRSEDIRAGSGLEWRIACPGQPQALAAAPFGDAGAQVEWTTPAGCRLAWIRLAYQRQPGTVRIAGVLELNETRLELLP